MLNLHTYQLDIPRMTERQWCDLLNARTELIIESRPDDPVSSHKEQRQFISNTQELTDYVIFWLLYNDDDNCVVFCSIRHPKPENPDYDTNKDGIYVEAVVLAPYRRQGAGTQLMPLIANYAKNVGASWMEWDTKLESGLRFSEKIGATEVGRECTNRLTVDQLNWDMMQHWVDEGRSYNPDVELIRFVNLPAPGLIAPFCDLVTDINCNMPKEDVKGLNITLTSEELTREAKFLKESKIERIILCAREHDTTLIGMTDLYYSKTKPTHAKVSLTGVRCEFQGRGLGKWLKAAMMLDIREHYPDVKFVDADNFINNRPVLNINNRMGFRLLEQYVFYRYGVSSNHMHPKREAFS